MNSVSLLGKFLVVVLMTTIIVPMSSIASDGRFIPREELREIFDSVVRGGYVFQPEGEDARYRKELTLPSVAEGCEKVVVFEAYPSDSNSIARETLFLTVECPTSISPEDGGAIVTTMRRTTVVFELVRVNDELISPKSMELLEEEIRADLPVPDSADYVAKDRLKRFIQAEKESIIRHYTFLKTWEENHDGSFLASFSEPPVPDGFRVINLLKRNLFIHILQDTLQMIRARP